MNWNRRLITRSLALGVATVVLLGACIPFMGDENGEEATPTPTPTITIIRPSPTAVAEPTAQPVEETTHVVKDGEVLGAIASQYGVTVDAIVKANNLSDPNSLSIGQKLIIPPPPRQEPTPTPAGPTVVQTPEPKN
jgi:LysM repeat protein